jgi:hypothetical protein
MADEPRGVPPAGNRAVMAAPTDGAIATLNAGSKVAVSARMQAVSTLASTEWQADAHSENSLVRALRADPSDSVRAHIAMVFSVAKYVTPKAHNALQNCVVGSDRDGFAGERSTTVKWHAGQALQKHLTSADPPEIIARQRETAVAKATRPASPPIVQARHDHSEESSPPEKTATGPFTKLTSALPSFGKSTPTDASSCGCAGAEPAMKDAKASSAKSLVNWITSIGKRPQTAPTETIIIVDEKMAAKQAITVVKNPPATRLQAVAAPTSALKQPTTIVVVEEKAPTKVVAPVAKNPPATRLQSVPNAMKQPATIVIVEEKATTKETVPIAKNPPTASRLQPVVAPASAPKATTIPTVVTEKTAAAPVSEKTTTTSVMPSENGPTLKERRVELRDMGLKDGTMQSFTQQVGAPPPTAGSAPQAESTGLFRRLFGSSK